jgi:ATP-dependent Lhr-like helicase
MERARLLFPDPRGRYGLFDIAAHGAMGTDEATRGLWELAWKSAVTNDSMEALRKGIMSGFAPAELEGSPHHPNGPARRSAMHRWAAGRPIQGSWRLLDTNNGDRTGIEAQELARERAKILFDRYGILFRELLENESESMGWKRLFPVLRLMELSGEIMSGYFFEDIPGVQFISFDAFRFLSAGLDEESIYWMNARDPASLCGIGIEGLRGKLPRRIPSNHLVFMGKNLVLESMKNCRELRINLPPDHPRLPECLGMFKTLLARGFNPLKGISVETINRVPAERSDYREALREFGFISVYKGLELRRRYH